MQNKKNKVVICLLEGKTDKKFLSTDFIGWDVRFPEKQIFFGIWPNLFMMSRTLRYLKLHTSEVHQSSI